jgi:outer membrane protein assembly factor BamD
MSKVILLSIMFIVVACSSEKPKGKTEAEVLFKEAEMLMDDGRYILATEKLNQLKNQYPYSIYATPSELLLADILYEQESYVESAAAYLLFRDFHPKHPKLPYVVYKIAQSYFEQIPDTFDRDLQPAFEAIKYYKELKLKYPNSKFSIKANKKITKCQTMIRDKEKYIADFYYKTENYDAALWRYKDILDNFKNKKLVKHSINRVVLSSYYAKDWQTCMSYSKKYQEYLVNNSEMREALNKCRENIQ